MAKAIWLGRSSFEAGFLNGLAGKPLPWTIPAWYSVNGVKIPALPKWNTGKYPNAFLWCVDPEKLKVCILYVMSGPVKVVDGQLIAVEDMELRAFTNQPHNNAVTGGFNHWRPLDSWSKAEGEPVAYGPSAVIWTNFDLYDTDDTLYLAATTPTVWVDEVTGDVTTGDDAGGGPMIERNLYFLGWLIGNRIASMRGIPNPEPEDIAIDYLYASFDPLTAESVLGNDNADEYFIGGNLKLTYLDGHLTIQEKTAQINITYPAGWKCTCGDLTAPDTSGSWTATVVLDNPGTNRYNISCTDGTVTISKTVALSRDEGQVLDTQMIPVTGTVTVTYPVGWTCTCGDLTAPDTSGTWSFDATFEESVGWSATVYCTDGTTTFSKAARLTADSLSAALTFEALTATVNVLYPEGWTTTCGNLTAPDTSGSWTFEVVVEATNGWSNTVSSTDGTTTLSQTTSRLKAGNLTETVEIVPVTATISITYPEGWTCRLSGGYTATAPDTSGSWTVEFIFEDSQSYTCYVRCTDGTTTVEERISIDKNNTEFAVVLTDPNTEVTA